MDMVTLEIKGAPVNFESKNRASPLMNNELTAGVIHEICESPESCTLQQGPGLSVNKNVVFFYKSTQWERFSRI
jgi:hypothetical protein